MYDEIIFLHSKLTHDECLRIVMNAPNWEIYADKTDIIGDFNGCIRIVRANGRLVSINPAMINLVCTMSKRSRY